jgi:hypothetical protein
MNKFPFDPETVSKPFLSPCGKRIMRGRKKGSAMMKTIGLILGVVIFLLGPGAEAKDFKFPEMNGWEQSSEIQTFIPKTLFEYINGAADLYLSYDFQELKVAEYQNDKKASVIVEAYRHKTPTHAFGIYSQERLSNANFLDVRAQGYIENNVLNFLTGSYYVKMTSYNTGAEDREILLTFAKKMSENLGEKGSLPSILSSFPEDGKRKNSEKFINRNFLGYSFLHSAFTADYELSGMKFKLFVIEGEGGNDCRDMIQKYLQQTGSLRKDIVEGCYTISDPYHGEIEVDWRGKYIGGILNVNDVSLRSKYLKLFEEGLKKK